MTRLISIPFPITGPDLPIGELKEEGKARAKALCFGLGVRLIRIKWRLRHGEHAVLICDMEVAA